MRFHSPDSLAPFPYVIRVDPQAAKVGDSPRTRVQWPWKLLLQRLRSTRTTEVRIYAPLFGGSVMGDLFEAILRPIGEIFGFGEDGDGLVLPGGGPLWIVLLTAVSLIGATLLWLWLA